MLNYPHIPKDSFDSILTKHVQTMRSCSGFSGQTFSWHTPPSLQPQDKICSLQRKQRMSRKKRKVSTIINQGSDPFQKEALSFPRNGSQLSREQLHSSDTFLRPPIWYSFAQITSRLATEQPVSSPTLTQVHPPPTRPSSLSLDKLHQQTHHMIFFQSTLKSNIGDLTVVGGDPRVIAVLSSAYFGLPPVAG